VVKPRCHEYVAGVELVKRAAKPGAVGLRAARRLAPHLPGTGGAQLLDLRFDALAVRRYPYIGMNHEIMK
jgi:hypothetical protein